MTAKKKATGSPSDFAPFAKFMENKDLLTKHLMASELAFGLAVASLADTELQGSKINDPKIVARRPDSYTDADLSVGVTRLYGWVNLEEYAELTGEKLIAVQEDARAGKLGDVEKHPKLGCEIVFWPKEKRRKKKAQSLALGMSVFSARVGKPAAFQMSFDTDDHELLSKIRSHIIHVGREVLGEPHEVFNEAKELMYRSSLLNLWTAFEAFIREAIGELVKRHPSALTNLPNGKRPALSYENVIALSHDFTDINALRNAIVSAEVARVEAGGQGVHGLINLLKSTFAWKQDPYVRKFTQEGRVCTTSYADLMEIKDVRNVLSHQQTILSVGLQGSGKLRTREGQIALEAESFNWAALVLTAVAHGISDDILEGRVTAK